MKKLLAGLVAVLIVGVALGYGIGWLLRHSQEETLRIPVVEQEPLPPREVTLYFAEDQGRYLVRTTDRIQGCEDDRDCLRGLLEKLIAGPQNDLIPVLPKQTVIRNVEIDGDLVRVDFSRHLVDLHPGGSLSELLTIHSLVNSLSESFPYVRQLQILVESSERETLKGHVRIDRPVIAEYAFTQLPTTGLKQDEKTPGRVDEGALEIDRMIREAVEIRDDPM